LAVDFKDGKWFWDNQNQQHLKLPELNFPDFKMEYTGTFSLPKPLAASVQ
jgi:hypothetical protein